MRRPHISASYELDPVAPAGAPSSGAPGGGGSCIWSWKKVRTVPTCCVR